MSYQLGIDLGTTYTAAAVCRSSDRGWAEPEVATLGTRNAAVPSVLFLPPDGSVVVGDAAERRALTDPDRVVREFKRRIGDPTPVVVGGRPWAPEELSARLVRWVVDRVAEREGGPAAAIAVTHPASWGTHKKELLARALGGQGLTVTFLAEPQAAALSYAASERVAANSTIAVYDLGGGTFDAAVVRKGDTGGFVVLGRPEGLERLGGIDFDEAVFDHVRTGMPSAFENLDEIDDQVLAAVARVRRECTEAKEALSSDTEVSIAVMMPGSRGSVRLHRSEFEALIRPQVEETVSALRSAILSAGVNPNELTTVLLVGGSSRIPLVGQLVSEQLSRPVAVDADPKNAIAKGAVLAVSPKPSASWPGVAVPPVAAAAGAIPGTLTSVLAPQAPVRPSRNPQGAGAGGHGGMGGGLGGAVGGAAAGGAAGAALGAGRPPATPGMRAAPPRPPSGPAGPPSGQGQLGQGQLGQGQHNQGQGQLGQGQSGPRLVPRMPPPGGAGGPAGAPHGGPPRQGPPRSTPTPPPAPRSTEVLPGGTAGLRRSAAHEPDWGYEEPDPERRRPIALYLGIFGILAAAALIVVLLVSGNLGGTGTDSDIDPTDSSQTDPGGSGGADPGGSGSGDGSGGGDSGSGGTDGSGGETDTATTTTTPPPTTEPTTEPVTPPPSEPPAEEEAPAEGAESPPAEVPEVPATPASADGGLAPSPPAAA